MTNLEELISLCKGVVSVTVNPQTANYESVKGYMAERINYDPFLMEEIGQDVIDEMIKRDTIVWVQAYPLTDVGYYITYHYDLNEAIQIVLKAVKGEKEDS